MGKVLVLQVALHSTSGNDLSQESALSTMDIVQKEISKAQHNRDTLSGGSTVLSPSCKVSQCTESQESDKVGQSQKVIPMMTAKGQAGRDIASSSWEITGARMILRTQHQVFE